MPTSMRSMTAFARSKKKSAFGNLTWEIRSVNHRYLDVNMRVPEFLNAAEMRFREILRKKLQRGRVDCFLRYHPNEKAGVTLTIDKKLAAELIKNAEVIQGKIKNSGAIDPLRILTMPDVLRQADLNTGALSEVAIALLQTTLAELLQVKEREGAALKLVIERILNDITKEIAKVKKHLPKVVAASRRKLIAKFAAIKTELDPHRLEQEMVFFAQKIDVAEELDRLEIHIKEFNRIMRAGGAIGKRLDFLLQELNREANTLASKSADIAITKSALELKVFLEQIREQVQNLE